MKLIGLLLSALLVAGVVWIFMPTKPADTTSATPSGATTLGAAAPTDVARNANAAKEHTKRQVCLADCASEFRTCKTLAADPSAEGACDEKKQTCDGRCP